MSNSNHEFSFVAFVAATLAGCGGSSPAPSTLSVDTPSPLPPAASPPPELSADADLFELVLTDVTVDQVFQSSIVNYTGTASSLVGQTQILATASDANASLNVDGIPLVAGTLSPPLPMQEGSNVFSVSVTAEDGVTTQIYTVDIERGTPASLLPSTYIKASNTGGFDEFGTSIALGSSRMAASAPLEDSSATGVGGDQINNDSADAGAVYIIE